MSSIALRTTATGSAVDAEGELARRASRGDRGAFDELFARHSDAGWRLAQAVAADRATAADSFRDGFVKAVKGRRASRRAAIRPLRDDILAAVYGAASASSYDASLTPASGLHRPAGGQAAALADAAFRSLPERWRAAVWLGDVEGFANERIASVMGVSTAVAVQLHNRGKRGLTGRFVQSHRQAPANFGPVLRTLAIPAPTDLAEFTLDGWSSVSATRRPVTALPAFSWLQENGSRPLYVAAGALLAFGFIGMGVIPEGGTVGGQLTAAGNSPLSGAVPVSTCAGCANTGGTTGATGANPVNGGGGFQTVDFATAGLTGNGIGPNLTGALSDVGSTATFGSSGATTTNSGGGASGTSGSGTTTGGGSTGSSGSSGGSGSGGIGGTGVGPTTTTTLPATITSTGSNLVTAVGNTVTGTASGLGTTVNDVTTNPTQVLPALGSTLTTTVSGVTGVVSGLLGGTTSGTTSSTTLAPTTTTTLAPTTTTLPSPTTTVTTTPCVLNVLGLCI